jgi:rhodanese-related sulfurtransferase
MQAGLRRILRLLKLYCVLLPLSFRPAQPRDFERIKELVAVKFSSVRQIKTNELEEWLGDNKRVSPLILDVRSEEEYGVSHLRSALRADSSNIRLLAGADKDRPMVLYCSVGYRSSALAMRLRKEGFTQVLNLEGSIFQWNIGSCFVENNWCGKFIPMAGNGQG